MNVRANKDKFPIYIKKYAYSRFNGQCVKCGSIDNLEYDHFIPVYHNGESTKGNVVLLCQDCNRKKSKKLYCPICIKELINCVCTNDEINNFIDSGFYIGTEEENKLPDILFGSEHKEKKPKQIIESFIKPKTKSYKCRGYLFCMYELLELSSLKIAKECGVSGATIRNWLREFNIRIRILNHPLYRRVGVNAPNYGKHWFWSEESKERSKERIRGKNHPNYGKRGAESSGWRGNDVGIGALYYRVRKNKPKPTDSKCEQCNKIVDENGIIKLELLHIKNYRHTDNPDDYQWVHRSCNRKYYSRKRNNRFIGLKLEI